MQYAAEDICNDLRNYRRLQAAINVMQMQVPKLPPLQAEKKRIQIRNLEERCALVKSWLGLLSDDEALIVEQHLIAGIDMARLEQMYRERWGEFGKSERTLRRYQKKAIEKIICFMNESKN